MKKIIYFIAVAIIATISLAGCNDFLDTQSEGAPTVDTYFNNDDQAINAIKALYAVIYDGDDGFGREIYWEQCATGMYAAGRTRDYGTTLLRLQPTGNEGPLEGTYNIFVQTIARANWVVESLLKKESGTTLSAVEKRSLGEAYFMRAFSHFTLAYRYGCSTQGFPFVKYEDFEGGYDNSIPTQQPTVMDNYRMIIEDLQKAKEYLPRFEEYTADDRGRAHQAAAVAMMSRVYAYWATWDKSQWDNVINCVNELENNYGRHLAPSFSKLFGMDWNPGEEGWWGPEYCFTFPSNGGADWKRGGIEWPGVILENKGWGVFNGWGQFKPTLDAYNEFMKDGAGNERLVKSILEYNQEFQFNGETRHFSSASDIETGFQINKWMEPFGYKDFVDNCYVNSSGDWPTVRCNFTVIRFADCMLLRAEANLAKGNNAAAAADLNKIRARVNLSQDCKGTWAELYHERYCELAYEPVADHLGDLRRWAAGGDAEIKAIAIAELEKHPDVRHYADRSDPTSSFTTGPYEDYQSPAKKWADYKVCWPYPANELSRAAGALKQNPGY